MPKIVWGPFVGDYAANGTDIYAQGTLPIGISTIFPASMPGQVSPLTAARSPVLNEISVGMSGEEAAAHTISDVPPLSLPDSLGYPLLSWSADLSPKQDLNGYANPWPAGGWKNKLLITSSSETVNDVTFTIYSDGTVNVDGTASANIVYSLNDTLDNCLNNATWYTLNGSPTNDDPTKWKLRVYNGSTDYIDTGSGVNFYFNSGSSARKCDIVVYQGTTMNNVQLKPMIRLMSVTDGTYAPYSNICPINGTDKVNLYVESSYDQSATPKAVINLPQTVYTGTVGSDGGEATWGNIASYNGETLPGEWISSMDVYAEGTTPTIGAQVVYELATPTTFAVPSVTIPTPRGTASAWATAENGTVDSMKVTYVGKA